MPIFQNALYWFTDDLRLHDNPCLASAADQSINLACMYIVDSDWFRGSQFGLTRCGDKRLTFLLESLVNLKHSLERMGQTLHILYGRPLEVLQTLTSDNQIDAIFRSRQHTYYEVQVKTTFEQRRPDIRWHEEDTSTVFDATFIDGLGELPKHFTPFRKIMERQEVKQPMAPVQSLPEKLKLNHQLEYHLSKNVDSPSLWSGGERAALDHLQKYFGSHHPSSYKKTRNELSGWHHSTKFSPWLAHGCLSPKMILQSLKQYEAEHGANDSTYWIYFESLWRDYFRWLAAAQGKHLFLKNGEYDKHLLKTFYPNRFKAWTQGSTPWPIVNASMKELNAKGYITNRARQIVASCLVNELDMDWRYGAAYFEQQLIDYDAASNWGNWQYIAGVGADPRGGRHFNLNKQTEQFDPLHSYIRQWQGEQDVMAEVDQVDMVDWPIR